MAAVHDPDDANAAVTELTSELGTYTARVESRIAELLEAEIARWSAIDPELEAPLRALQMLVDAGGKRLRPAFCFAAFLGAGGDPGDPRIVDAGGALELLHTSALIHDDVMDASDVRRGDPTVHRQFVERHDALGHRGEARRFGESAAILVGDLALVYSDVLMPGVDATTRAVYDELRLELMVGQYLDLVGTAGRATDLERAHRIERYKSAKYTVERPLHLGAAVAGCFDALAAPLSAIGLPLGAAFQLRDDLLGVFGDAAVTGKPVGGDLREGKLTPLLAEAASRAGDAEPELFARLGAADLTDGEIAGLQALFAGSGARAAIEAAIDRLVLEALAAIDAAPLAAEARVALRDLAAFAAWRDR